MFGFPSQFACIPDFQRALWMVDETEARWQRYIRQLFPSLNFTEIYWESTRGLSNHTFEHAVRANKLFT
jgi:hypothetical protein